MDKQQAINFMKTGVGGGGVGDRGRWAARGRLKPPLGLTGLAMSSRGASHIWLKYTQKA